MSILFSVITRTFWFPLSKFTHASSSQTSIFILFKPSNDTSKIIFPIYFLKKLIKRLQILSF
jgi:hypothetical protein